MPFYVFAWIASFLFGLVGIIGKLTSKHSISNPWLFNFLWTLLSLLLILPVALINNVGIPSHWTNLTFVALFNALFNTFYILGISMLDVSVMVPLLNLRTGFVAIIGALFLGEILSVSQYFLVVLIFLGGLFVSVEEKFTLRSFFKFPILIAILCTLSYTLMGVFTKGAIAENGYWEVTLWSPILSQIMLLVTIPKFKKEIGKINLKQACAVFTMSLALALGVMMENRAYKENVVITNIITALPFSLVMAFLFSIFAPKLLEKHTFKVYAIRFTAAAIMIVSALKLSM
jgi:drug/metabolite transporter (DMT)-like permease